MNAMEPFTVQLASCYTGTDDITYQKHHVVSHFDYLDPMNAMLFFQGCWHHMIPMLALTVSHYQGSHVLLYFNDHDVENAIVPLTMSWTLLTLVLVPMVLHDQRGHVVPHFDCLDWRNAMVLFTGLLVWHHTDVGSKGATWLKRWCCTSLLLFCPKNCAGVINDGTSIIWWWHQCQLHLIWII